MFRMPGLPAVDPAEERRRVRENVKMNMLTFIGLLATIRIAPFLLKQLNNN